MFTSRQTRTDVHNTAVKLPAFLSLPPQFPFSGTTAFPVPPPPANLRPAPHPKFSFSRSQRLQCLSVGNDLPRTGPARPSSKACHVNRQHGHAGFSSLDSENVDLSVVFLLTLSNGDARAFPLPPYTPFRVWFLPPPVSTFGFGHSRRLSWFLSFSHFRSRGLFPFFSPPRERRRAEDSIISLVSW